jgi:hypothetical protein
MKKIIILILLSISILSNAQIAKNANGLILRSGSNVVLAPDAVNFISVQTGTVSQVVINMKVASGKTVVLSWGNGSIITITGTGSNVYYTSSYSIAYKANRIQIYGELDQILWLGVNSATVRIIEPNDFLKLTSLESINLQSTIFKSLNLSSLPTSLLRIKLNVSSLVTGSITEFTAVDTLLLQATSNTISGSVAGLSSLRYINCWGSNTISGSVAGLTNLRVISIAGSNTVSGSVSSLTNLEVLEILGSNTISGSLSNLTNLSYVWLAGSSTVSADITNLTSLYLIHQAGSQSITGSISNLTNLTTVYIPSTNTISGSVAGLSKLNYILLRGSNTVSGSVSSLTNLTYLEILGSNTVSGSVSSLTNLTSIGITGSLISIINASSLTLLVTLQVYNNSNFTSFTAPSSSALLTNIYLYADNVDKFDFTNTTNIRGDLRIYSNANDTAFILPATLTGSFTRIDAHNNALNLRSVNNTLSKLNTYFTNHTPTSNLYLDLSGGTNSVPTGGSSNTDLQNLIAIFNAAGKIFTCNINT